MRQFPTLITLAGFLVASCSYIPLEGDRHFKADRLEKAAAAYREHLRGHPRDTLRSERALYHLGLIYSLPGSPLYDLDLARKTLSTVALEASNTAYRRHASLILDLQAEVSRLREARAQQARLAAMLENEVGRLEEQAAEASTAAGEHAGRASRLGAEIRQLRTEINRLTTALEKREQALERIKEIDLERIP